MTKETKLLLSMLAGGLFFVKVVAPRLPTLPGMAPRKPGSHAAYSNDEWAALQAQQQIASR